MNKFEIQDNEYKFPYHYLVTLENSIPSITKKLGWGIEYLTYINYIQRFIDATPHNSWFDIGCGDGYLINSFNYDSNRDYYGIDFSERAIKFANAFTQGYFFEVKDVFNVEHQYDIISLVEVIEHIPDNFLNEFLAQSCSLVRPGGFLIISVPTDVTPVQQKHYRHYNEMMFDKIIPIVDFDIISNQRLYKKSKLLDKIVRFVFKRRSKFLRKLFWKVHMHYFYYADISNGKHIVRIYQKRL